jgi:hypothetical protein
MNKNIIRIGIAAVAMGTALLMSPSAKAQFTGSSDGSAIRAAYSTVSVGGAAHSYALEVLNPDTVMTNGSYAFTVTWTDPTGAGVAGPDTALFGGASMVTTTAELQGSPLTFEAAVAGAINSASAGGNYENAEAMIEKFVGGDGVSVTID